MWTYRTGRFLKNPLQLTEGEEVAFNPENPPDREGIYPELDHHRSFGKLTMDGGETSCSPGVLDELVSETSNRRSYRSKTAE